MARPLTARFEAYVAPARRKPQVWRLIAGSGVCIAVYLGGLTAIFGGIWVAEGPGGLRHWLGSVARADTPSGTMLLLVTFLGMALGPIAAVRLLHGRSARTLFGRPARMIRDFTICAGVVAVVYAGSLTLWFAHFDGVPNLDPAAWARLLPMAVAGLLLQTGAEELLFRGYLQQQLAARFRTPLVWMGVPSLAFGAVHFDPAGLGGNLIIVVGATGFFGLAAADLTRVTGNLGAAWALHFTNNFAALLIVATDGTLTGLALFTTPYAAADTALMPGMVLADLVVLVLAWALARRVLGR